MDGTPSFFSSPVAQAASARLRNHPYAAIQKLSCECDDCGVLVLRGRLPSYYHKQLAQTAVARIPGVREVINHAEVVSRTL